MPQIIKEAGTLTTGATGKLLITLITPGWGSSGYYSPALLEQAAKDKVFPAGTQQHIDHMSRKDAQDQPAGSLTTLAAVLTEDARWEGGRLVAEAKLGSRYRDTITEFAEYIGTSIAVGADVTIGEAEGRKGQIIEKLYPDPLNRVDFVTVAGRGGKVDKVLEAIAGRAVEATANDTRNALSAAVTEAYGADGVWLWVLDYDDTNVWFTQESADESKTWQQTYTMGDTAAELTGDLVEVRRVTSYVPVTPATESKNVPSNPAGLPQPNDVKETNMGKIEVDEAAHTAAVEASGRVPVLEAENADLKAKLAESAKKDNDATAAAVVAEAFKGIDAPATVKLLASTYTLTAEGAVDTAALKAKAEEAAAEIAASFGAGTVRGVGHTSTAAESAEPADADVLTALKGA